MKMFVALTSFAMASIAEKLFRAQNRSDIHQLPATYSELTDEIRRYDIEDLILP